METRSVYNALIMLEEGDLIAVENDRLFIHSDGKLYVACDKASSLSLDKEIYVNSAGNLTNPLHKELYKDLDWQKY